MQGSIKSGMEKFQKFWSSHQDQAAGHTIILLECFFSIELYDCKVIRKAIYIILSMITESTFEHKFKLNKNEEYRADMFHAFLNKLFQIARKDVKVFDRTYEIAMESKYRTFNKNGEKRLNSISEGRIIEIAYTIEIIGTLLYKGARYAPYVDIFNELASLSTEKLEKFYKLINISENESHTLPLLLSEKGIINKAVAKKGNKISEQGMIEVAKITHTFINFLVTILRSDKEVTEFKERFFQPLCKMETQIFPDRENELLQMEKKLHQTKSFD